MGQNGRIEVVVKVTLVLGFDVSENASTCGLDFIKLGFLMSWFHLFLNVSFCVLEIW